MGQLTKHMLLNLCPQCNYQNEDGGFLSLKTSVLSGGGAGNICTPRTGVMAQGRPWKDSRVAGCSVLWHELSIRNAGSALRLLCDFEQVIYLL